MAPAVEARPANVVFVRGRPTSAGSDEARLERASQVPVGTSELSMVRTGGSAASALSDVGCRLTLAVASGGLFPNGLTAGRASAEMKGSIEVLDAFENIRRAQRAGTFAGGRAYRA